MSILFKGQKVLALGIYNYENNDCPMGGDELKGAYVAKLPYFGEESLQHVQDLWSSAQAACVVLGGNEVGMAALVGSSWFDTAGGDMLAPDIAFG